MGSVHRIASRLRFAEYRRSRRAARRVAAPEPAGAGAQPPRSLARLLRALFGLLRGYRATLAGALGLLTVATALNLIPPAATKLVIDDVLLARRTASPAPPWLPPPGEPRARLVALAVGVLVISILGSLIGLGGRYWATRTTKRVQVAIRRRVFEHAVRLPLHRVYHLKSGGAASLLREDAGGVGELVFSLLYNPWRAVVQFAGGLVVLAWVDARLLLGSLVLVPGVYATERLWMRRIRPLHREVREQRQSIDAMATEVFGGMRVVRAFGRQRRETARFVGEGHFMARLELFAWTLSRGVELLWDLLFPLASGLLLLYGGLRVLEGRLTLGELMMFLVYLAMLLEPVAVLASTATQLQNNLAGFDRVLDVLEEPRELAGRPGTVAVRKASVAGGLTLRGVGFSYPGTARPVLRDVDLQVEPGEVVALVGRSGAGKTTLCNLIARFYDPTAGVIALDGVDLRDIEVQGYRRLLGIVEQDVFLFDGTVAENIGYAARHAPRAEVERAARVANAEEFIAQLPEGYDTRIGERGVRLSGGQRQRLAIARAVLADPRIFLLDEATSNLDSESERLIQAGLAALLRGRTSFVIAHRLSTIRGADRILVLEAGALVESGTHAALMARSGRYRAMVELQHGAQGSSPTGLRDLPL